MSDTAGIRRVPTMGAPRRRIENTSKDREMDLGTTLSGMPLGWYRLRHNLNLKCPTSGISFYMETDEEQKDSSSDRR